MRAYFVSWFISISFCFFYFIGLTVLFSSKAMAGVEYILSSVLMACVLNLIFVRGFGPFPRGKRARALKQEIKETWASDRRSVIQTLIDATAIFSAMMIAMGILGRQVDCFMPYGGYRCGYRISDIFIFATVFGFWALVRIVFTVFMFSRRHHKAEQNENEKSRSYFDRGV